MSSSNGADAPYTGPVINQGVEELLRSARARKANDEEIGHRLEPVIDALLAAFPDHQLRVADRLEAYAASIRHQIEAEKIKERARGTSNR